MGGKSENGWGRAGYIMGKYGGGWEQVTLTCLTGRKWDKTLVPVRSRRPRPDFQTFKMGTATERGASGVVTEHGGFIGV